MPNGALLRGPSDNTPHLPQWIDRLVSAGIVATDPDIVRRQRCVNISAAAISVNSLSHLVINAFYDLHGLAILHAYNLLMAVLPLSVPLLHRFGENVAAIVLAISVLFAHAFAVCALGVTSDLHIYYTSGGALLLLFGVQNWRLYLVFFALYVAALIAAVNLAPIDGFLLPEEGALRDLVSTHALINTITLNSIVLFYALTALRRAEVDLQAEHRRSESLLAAVMPTSVVERLKTGEETRIADRIETLSVLFADVVGFTSAVHEMPPEDVVAYLDRLVRRFDSLCERHADTVTATVYERTRCLERSPHN